MAEYIDREAAIVAAKHAWAKGLEPSQYIEIIQSADVAKVRHAKWEVVVGSDGKEHMVCTGCCKQQDLTGVFSYCPNCGARMDDFCSAGEQE